MQHEQPSKVFSIALLTALAVTSSPAWALTQLVAGMDLDGGSIHVVDPATGGVTLEPFGSAFMGGVRVAAGDLTGDGTADLIVGTGPGSTASVRIINGANQQVIGGLIEPYGSNFIGGVYVGAGDVNADGIVDIITGPSDDSEPTVKVFDGRTGAELHSFLAYDAAFRGGVRVGAGDVNGDGHADIITGPGSGAAPHVKVFSGRDGSELHQFIPFSTQFMGGVFVGAGDFDGDGDDDLVVASGADPVPGAGGGPHVKVFNGTDLQVLADFRPYDTMFTGGVRVALGDIDGDGLADIITAPGDDGPPLLTGWLSPDVSNNDDMLVFNPAYRGGLFVAASVVTPTLLRDSFE